MNTKHAVATMVAVFGLIGTAVAQPHGGGSGMSGGAGYGMGAGMMNGYGGGYGMGSGMMNGDRSDYGMGPGMMSGCGNQPYANLKLSADQRKKITAIHQETSKAMWQLMGTMHEQRLQMQGMFGPGPFDEAAERKAFETMQQTQKAMFEKQLEAHGKIDAVLTQEQREQLSR